MRTIYVYSFANHYNIDSLNMLLVMIYLKLIIYLDSLIFTLMMSIYFCSFGYINKRNTIFAF